MTRNTGLWAQISYILLVCSRKSQLSNYVNAHCLQISIWTTLCHDITTYDISWQPYCVDLISTMELTTWYIGQNLSMFDLVVKFGPATIVAWPKKCD